MSRTSGTRQQSCQVYATSTRLSLLKISMALRRQVCVRIQTLAIFNGWKTGFFPITTHCRSDWKSDSPLAYQGLLATRGAKRYRREQIIYQPVLLDPELILCFQCSTKYERSQSGAGSRRVRYHASTSFQLQL